MTKRCTLCPPSAVREPGYPTWIWQPFGPGEVTTATRPGYHYRGFPAIGICSFCLDDLQSGIRRGFDYRGLHFVVDTQQPTHSIDQVPA